MMADRSNEELIQPQQVTALLTDVVRVVRKHTLCDTLRVMRREELSLAQMSTLWHLHYRGGASISQIRDHLNLSLAATSHLVERLVRAGLVERTENSIDRRHKQVTLTPAGRALVIEIERARDAELTNRLNALPPPLLAALIEPLTQLRDVLHHAEAQSVTQADAAIDDR